MIENYANAVYVRESVSVHEIGLPHVVEEVPQLCSCFIGILFRKHYWNEASRVQKYVNLTIPEEDKAVVLKRFSHI